MRLTWSPEDEGVFDDVMKINNNWTGTPVINVNLSGVGVVPVGTYVNLGAGCGSPLTLFDSVHNELIDGVSPYMTWNTGGSQGTAYFSGIAFNNNPLIKGCTPMSGADGTQKAPAGMGVVINSRQVGQTDIAFDAVSNSYITIGAISLTGTQNPNEMGYYNRMSFMIVKPRDGMLRTYYFNNGQPAKGTALGVVSYSGTPGIVSSTDNTSHIIYQMTSEGIKFFKLDLSVSGGMVEMTAPPYFVNTSLSGSNPSNPRQLLAESLSTFSRIIDGSNNDVLWMTSIYHGVYTYNVKTGAIIFKHPVSKLPAFANMRAMDKDGYIYNVPAYVYRVPAITSYPVKKTHAETGAVTEIASIPVVSNNGLGTYYLPYGVYLSKDQSYLYITGNPYRYKVKVK